METICDMLAWIQTWIKAWFANIKKLMTRYYFWLNFINLSWAIHIFNISENFADVSQLDHFRLQSFGEIFGNH